MNNLDKKYLDLVRTILKDGVSIPNRTGTNAITHTPMMIQHDMSEGFPILTTKKVAFKSVKVELEFFIKGLTDKRWLEERGCKIWSEWSSQIGMPKNLSKEERLLWQKNNPDLGALGYSHSWRNFGGDYRPLIDNRNALQRGLKAITDVLGINRSRKGFDQLKFVIDGLKKDPTNRKLVCSAWEPQNFGNIALEPCHYSWHVFAIGNKLNLSWTQRSVDFFLGLPFNISSYGLLLHLLCKETGLEEGTLTGFLSNCHIYENHIEQFKVQLKRSSFKLPKIETTNFSSIYNWDYEDSLLTDYKHHDTIKGHVAV